MDVIKSFKGKYQFLSNFYPCGIWMDGQYYPSVEHAFQAAKTFDIREREAMACSPSAADAKYWGRRLALRKDWESVKGQIMLDLLRAKFSHESLKQKLLDTGNCELIEGNRHGDTFWGQVGGEGKNMLGKFLMQVRTELREGKISKNTNVRSW